MMIRNSLNPTVAIWPASLAAATLVGSLALACIFPFAAFATLAALTMRPRHGLALVAAVWTANQATGFFLLSFPWDAQAVGHGIAILVATLAAFYAARLTAAKLDAGVAFRGTTALVSAFVVYQLLLRGYAQFGGGAENFSADIVTGVAINDALWFAALMALRFLLLRATGDSRGWAQA